MDPKTLLHRLIEPSSRLTAEARRRAEQKAAEEGVSIDRVYVVAWPFGVFKVGLLDDQREPC